MEHDVTDGRTAGPAGILTGARRALDALRPLMPATPCQPNLHLSQLFGAEIWLKREDLSPVRSYKIRGAVNAMRKARAAGATAFVCASAGNHAQGVAWACRHFGVPGAIFMPVTTPAQKVGKTRAFGGARVTIHQVGDIFDAALAAARDHAAKTGAHFLSPFDDPDVIEGQAGVALEILQQMPTPDLVVVPVGGGGLSAGTRAVIGALSPETRIAFAEPQGGASLAAALAAGAPVTLPALDAFVDGAAVARIGAAPLAHLAGVDAADVIGVPEDRLCGTILEMLNVEGIVLEPAGALAVDALRDLGPRVAGARVVCVTSGGNFDFERLPDVKERAQRYAGLKKYFVLRLPQRPGALRDFLELLGPEDDIARFEYLKKSARETGSVLIGIETARRENFERLFAAMEETGLAFRDITNDALLAELLI